MNAPLTVRTVVMVDVYAPTMRLAQEFTGAGCSVVRLLSTPDVPPVYQAHGAGDDVYGADMNVHRIRRIVGDDVVICLDAAQSVGHLPVPVADLGVDFVAFSGHKAMALPGIGVLWARNARGPRYRHRGWEGTPNTTGLVSLLAAIDWFDHTDVDRIARWTVALGARLTDGLHRMPSLRILGCQDSLTLDSGVQRRHGLVTFRHPGISSADLGFVLAQHGLMVRANAHCQGPAGERESSVRVSLHAYNTAGEIDRLLGVLAELDHSLTPSPYH